MAGAGGQVGPARLVTITIEPNLITIGRAVATIVKLRCGLHIEIVSNLHTIEFAAQKHLAQARLIPRAERGLAQATLVLYSLRAAINLDSTIRRPDSLSSPYKSAL